MFCTPTGITNGKQNSTTMAKMYISDSTFTGSPQRPMWNGPGTMVARRVSTCGRMAPAYDSVERTMYEPISAENAEVESTNMHPRHEVIADTATVARSGESKRGEMTAKKLLHGKALSRDSVHSVRPPVISVPMSVGNVARKRTAVSPIAPALEPVACR